MGFLDKLKNTLLGAEFGNEDEFFVEEYDEDDQSDESTGRESRRKEREFTDFSEHRSKRSDSRYGDSKVLSIHTEQPRDKIVITRPKTIADAPLTTDYLLANMACIVNLESVEHNDAQRIADFLGGTAYALNCEVERVNNDVFVIAPPNMNIASELKEEIKNSGSILPWIASAFK